MYRRPKFLEVLLEIRQEMAREADYDVDLFAEMVRRDGFSNDENKFVLSENRIENDSAGNSNKNPKSEIQNRKSN